MPINTVTEWASDRQTDEELLAGRCAEAVKHILATSVDQFEHSQGRYLSVTVDGEAIEEVYDDGRRWEPRVGVELSLSFDARDGDPVSVMSDVSRALADLARIVEERRGEEMRMRAAARVLDVTHRAMEGGG